MLHSRTQPYVNIFGIDLNWLFIKEGRFNYDEDTWKDTHYGGMGIHAGCGFIVVLNDRFLLNFRTTYRYKYWHSVWDNHSSVSLSPPIKESSIDFSIGLKYITTVRLK